LFKFSKLSFEVACLLKANPSSLEFIPSPLSDTIISVLPPSLIKILISSIIMSFTLVFSLEKFSSFLDYEYIYKSIYLIIIIGFVGIIYLLSCYLLGLLKIKSYKTN